MQEAILWLGQASLTTGSRGALDDRTNHDEALPTNEAGLSRFAVLFCRLETCVAERAGMANGISWQATMHAAGTAHGS